MSKSSKSEDPHDPTYAQLGDLLNAMSPNAYETICGFYWLGKMGWIKWHQIQCHSLQKSHPMHQVCQFHQ